VSFIELSLTLSYDFSRILVQTARFAVNLREGMRCHSCGAIGITGR
jgi:hypothetical protein